MTVSFKDLKIKSAIASQPRQLSLRSQLTELKMQPVIVFCFPGRSFSGTFLKCWTDTLHFCMENGIDCLMINEYSSMVHFSRTKCLGANVLRGKNQKPFDGKLLYTHLMWIDSDMAWFPQQIGQLLLRNVDVVAGLYTHEDRNNFVAYKNCNLDLFKKQGRFESLKRDEVDVGVLGEKDLIEVDYTGMGFMLIKHGVIESLEYPWFRSDLRIIGDDIQDIASEDASFCASVKSKFKIYVDPTVLVGHEKSIIIN